MALIDIEAVTEQFQGKTVTEVFTEKRLLVHEHATDAGTYRLHINRPLAGVGAKMPQWRIQISVALPDGSTETLNDGKALAPWTALHEVVQESLRVMAVYVEQGQVEMVKGRRAGMRAV